MSLVPSWSYTAVMEYLNCPRKYQLNRVLKVMPFQETDAMRQGNLIHKHLENRIREGTKLPLTLQSLEPVIQRMERKVIDGEWMELGAEVEIVYNRDMAPVGRWAQTSPRPWFSKDAWFRAKFDVVALLNKKRAMVLDWKTGKRKTDLPQLELFAACAFKSLPDLEKVTTGYAWTPLGGKVDKQVFYREGYTGDDETVSKKSEATIWGEWLGHVERIEQSMQTDKWPCRPSGLCGWCDATPKQCPHSKK